MPPVDPDRRACAAELHAAGREHDARHADRSARSRNVEPETARMLDQALLPIGAGVRLVVPA